MTHFRMLGKIETVRGVPIEMPKMDGLTLEVRTLPGNFQGVPLPEPLPRLVTPNGVTVTAMPDGRVRIEPSDVDADPVYLRAQDVADIARLCGLVHHDDEPA